MQTQLALGSVFLLIFFLTVEPTVAQPRSADFRELDKVMLDELRETNTPGAAIVMVSGDRVIYAKGFGVSSIETGAAVTPDTLFFLASTTKMMTASVLVSVAEERNLPLDQPIGSYVKDLGPRLSRITINQLLSHCAGLVNGTPEGAIEWHDEFNRAGLAGKIRAYKDSDYFFTEPGRLFSYANTGYALAGFLIQELTGKPYWEEMHDRLFQPLRMNHSTFQPRMAMTFPLAQRHTAEGKNKPTVIRPFDDDVAYRPAGFAYSSVNDLARFAIALVNGGRIDGKQVLSPTVIGALAKPQADVPFKFDIATAFFTDVKYGLGCFIQEHRGVHVVEHAGADEGAGSLLVLVPKERFAVIVLANKEAAIFGNAAEKAMELVLALTPKPAPDHGKTVPMTPAEMESYVGSYVNGDQKTVLRVQDGKLYRTDSEGAKPVESSEPVTKIGTNRFAFMRPGSPGQTEFILIPGADGRIEYLFSGLVAATRAEVRKP